MKVPNVYGPVKEFFSGFFWPLTWLGSGAASAGLLLAMFLLISFSGFMGVTAIAYIFSSDSFSSDSGSESMSETVSDFTSPDASTSAISPGCNIVGVEIRGCIMTYKPEGADSILSDACDAITSSEYATWAIETAASNPQIKAVLLQIDSGGGSPVAAEEIVAALGALGKPSVAWVRESAASAAYWIASTADTIIAAESSDIGSIGVTYSYVDNAKQNLKDGLTYNQLTTGKYKDTGTPDRALTADERALIQRDLDISLQIFIKAVAANRNLSVAKVTALADGSSMLGSMALKNGLIDQLGTMQEVWQQLEADIGDKPHVCWP